MAAADRARWDWHPRLNTADTGLYADGLPTLPADRRGLYYTNPSGDFSDMVTYMKEFMATGWGAINLAAVAADPLIPLTPQIAYEGGPGFPANRLTFRATPFSASHPTQRFEAIEWRLGEVSDATAPAYDPRGERSYEIRAIWESGELSSEELITTIPGDVVRIGHAYRARVRMKDDAGRWSHWSPPVQFVVQEGLPTDVVEALRIVEIHYNPAPPTAAELIAMPGVDNDEFEFLELQNIDTTATINLANVRFSGGVDFTFPDFELGPRERIVVVENTAAFQLRYGLAATVLGSWSGGLSGSGEELVLTDAAGVTVLDFAYDDHDPWPLRADGSGASLELIDPLSTPVDQYGKYHRWRPSTELGGTPGAAGSGPLGVVINEVWARTDASQGELDAVELYNTSATAIDMGGWFLSDSDTQLLKFAIPEDTLLGPGQYITFDENDFNPNPAHPAALDFALNGTRGDEVWLVSPAGPHGGFQFVDDVRFGSAAQGESVGRNPNGSGRLVPLQTVTLGRPNAEPRVGPLWISELQYKPAVAALAALQIEPTLTAEDLEFIEIYNPTSELVDLTEWRIRGGVEFDFVSDTLLESGQTLLIVAFDAMAAANANRLLAFRAHYGLDAAAKILGGYGDALGDTADRVLLLRADESPPEDPDFIPRVTEDEVLYDDVSPWPVAGNGASLTRTLPPRVGGSPASWTSRPSSPGVPPRSGDFNGDGHVNGDDFLIWQAAFGTSTGATAGDGDADGDGDVDGNDFLLWQAHFDNASGGDGNSSQPDSRDGLSITAMRTKRARAIDSYLEESSETSSRVESRAAHNQTRFDKVAIREIFETGRSRAV